MSTDHIRYDILAQEALRGVVQRVLADAAKKGLPGDHHFYVSFDTNAPDVRISPRLREQYPQEMTIVLQHQFWDLIVTDDGFEVGLSFNGVPERLAVPFQAIKGFFDPSVQFGLQFEAAAEVTDTRPAEPAETLATTPPEARKSKPQRVPRAKPAKLPAAPAAPVPVPAQPEVVAKKDDSGEAPKPSGGGQVVRLDRFRKK